MQSRHGQDGARGRTMLQLLIVVCCVLGCPLLVGGGMWLLGRDWQGKRLEREIRRLNRRAGAAARSTRSSDRS